MKKLFLLFIFSLLVFSCEAQSWYPLGSGLVGNDQFYDRVNTLCADSNHNHLWAGGSFQIAGGDSISDLAYWNGSDWFPLLYINSQNDTAEYQFIAEVSSSIMFHGKFLFAAAPNLMYGFDRWRLYSYDADSLSLTVIGTFDNRINSMEIFQDTLYVAGTFSDYQSFTSGNPNIALNGIAKWNETDFIPVGLGTDGGEVNALCVHNGNLIAGGFFEYIDGTYCKNIAQWNGSQWLPIGNGIGVQWDYGPQVYCLASYLGKLYIGGLDFDIVSQTDLLIWDGLSFSNSIEVFSEVNTIKKIDGKLYIGGGFCTSLQYPNTLVYCDDGVYIRTGDGPDQQLSSIESFGGQPYIAGELTGMYNHPGEYFGFVARFDPTLIPTILSYGICAGATYNFNGVLLDSSGVTNFSVW